MCFLISFFFLFFFFFFFCSLLCKQIRIAINWRFGGKTRVPCFVGKILWRGIPPAVRGGAETNQIERKQKIPFVEQSDDLRRGELHEKNAAHRGDHSSRSKYTGGETKHDCLFTCRGFWPWLVSRNFLSQRKC